MYRVFKTYNNEKGLQIAKQYFDMLGIEYTFPLVRPQNCTYLYLYVHDQHFWTWHSCLMTDWAIEYDLTITRRKI